MYQPNKTQEQKILDLLKERGSAGVMAWEIPSKLQILQYNARVHGLRKKGYDIRNNKGKFTLYQEPVQEYLVSCPTGWAYSRGESTQSDWLT